MEEVTITAPEPDNEALSLEEMTEKFGRVEVTKELIDHGTHSWTKEEHLYVARSALLDGNVVVAQHMLEPLGFSHRGGTLTRAIRAFLDRQGGI